MGNIALSICAGSNTTSSTVFLPIGGSIGQGNHGSESQAQIVCRTPGVFSNLQVNSTANTPTILFRVNGVTGNQTISAGGQVTDSTHTDSVGAGDKVALDLSAGASVVLQELSSYFTATANTTASRLNSTGTNSGLSANNTTVFYVPGGRCAATTSTTEANCQVQQEKGGTMQNLAIFVNSNSRNVTDTPHDRINGGNGSLTTTIGSGASGVFEDSTHSTSVGAGDLYCFGIAMGASSSSMSLNQYSVEFNSSGGASEIVDGISDGISMSSGSVQKWYLGGELQSNTNEAQRQASIQATFTFSGLGLSTITNTTVCTLVFRDGGVTGNESIATSAGTGFFNDTTHTDLVAVNDLVNYQYTVGGSASTVTNAVIWGSTPVTGGFARQFTIKYMQVSEMHFTPTTSLNDIIGS